jgi:hypothetical protein
MDPTPGRKQLRRKQRMPMFLEIEGTDCVLFNEKGHNHRHPFSALFTLRSTCIEE